MGARTYILTMGLAAGTLAFGPTCAQETILAGTGQPLPLTFFGMHAHRLGEPTPWPSGLTIGAYRAWDAKVRWADLETSPGRWEFGRLDRLVGGARQRGIDVLLPLGMPPAWASARPGEPSAYRPGEAASPRDMSTWRNYVRMVANRYNGQVHYYEIWNEPNLRKFFSGTPSEAVALTCAAKEELGAVDASIKLVSPAPTGAYGVPWLVSFFAAGGQKCIDIVGFHFYNSHLDPESHIPLFNKIEKVMAAGGAGAMPLWNTETGWLIASTRRDMDPASVGFRAADRVLSDEDSTRLIARTLLLHAAMGVARFYWYALDNDMMGLVERDGTPKPAWRAYEDTVALMRGRRIGPCTSLDRRLWTCELSAGSVPGAARVHWLTSAEPGRQFVAAPAAIRYEQIGKGVLSQTDARQAFQAGAVIVEWLAR